MRHNGRPVVLAILDGWGISPPDQGNAIAMAETPWMDRWQSEYPHSQLVAYGESVGLLPGTTGNSEVGHINLGAGYVVEQDEVRINRAINDKTFFANYSLIHAFQQAKKPKSALHLIGLVGPGEVHSRLDHLWALLDMAKQQHIDQVYVHLFSDGRDAPPKWMGKNSEAVQKQIEQRGGIVASLCGRYWAMDRNNQWDRTALAYHMLVDKKGKRAATLAGAVKLAYDRDETDEFIEPTIIANGKAITDGDCVIFFNFRTDRPRQLTEAFVQPDFKKFKRTAFLSGLSFFTMTEYQKGLPVTGVIFPPAYVKHPLAEVVSRAGLRQLHISETEKYAHVTFFINGGREEPFSGEDRVLIPSPKVATYDLEPAMSSGPLTEAVVKAIESDQYSLIIMNYPNADMVGHSGNLPATIKAVEAIDECLGILAEAILAKDGVLMITADHGNAEAMLTIDHQANTQHHSAKVPLLAIGHNLPGRLKEGRLSNVAPTILHLMGLTVPEQMTSDSLWTDRK